MSGPRAPLAEGIKRHIAQEAEAAYLQGATEIRVVFTAAGRAQVLRCFESVSIAIRPARGGSGARVLR